MNYKVEINGIDTSKLPKVSGKEQLEIIKRYKDGEVELKDKIIECNLRLVLSIVKKFNNRGENVDDIFQIGVIGLIKAINNFDTIHGVQFSTYAVPMIIGEIKRYLRDNSAFRISRSIRDLSLKLSQIREEYINKNNEEPTIEKLCELSEESREDVVIALDSTISPVSLSEVLYNDGGDCIYIQDKIKDNTDNAEDVSNKVSVKQILDNLNSKEREIIIKRYFDDKTQTELSVELGVSQAQISRIEKNVIEKLRKKMA
ncbi:MAG: SigB/SigF/SigG family RNA polymerase sigma factor [Clostridia bacterium]